MIGIGERKCRFQETLREEREIAKFEELAIKREW